ncbi:hypothetical protein D3C87_1593620 [compost metagenome]
MVDIVELRQQLLLLSFIAADLIDRFSYLLEVTTKAAGARLGDSISVFFKLDLNHAGHYQHEAIVVQEVL